MKKFEVFKEIVIGDTTKEELLKNLTDSGVQFNKYAHILFDHPDFLPILENQKVMLVKVSLADLGLADSCTTKEFEYRAAELDLKLCPLYLAAFLRLQYLDQPSGPYLTFASKKPENNVEYPNGFYIRNFENVLGLRKIKAEFFLPLFGCWLFGVVFPFVLLGLKPYVANFVINNFCLKMDSALIIFNRSIFQLVVSYDKLI